MAAGIVWGLASLTRPSYPYLIYTLAIIAVAWACRVAWRRHGDLRFTTLALTLVASYAVTVAPWEARNLNKFDHYIISDGYAPYILYQRVMFNEMTPAEWGASFVFALPNINKPLLRALHIPPRDYVRHGYAVPDGFYQQGQTRLPRYRQFLADAGGLQGQMRYLLGHYILAHPFKHIWVTVALAWRGMWVGKVWGLIMMPAFAAVLVRAIRTGWWDFVLFTFPPWFMLGFNAFTSVNVSRYNLTLLPCLAIAGACAVHWLYDLFLQRGQRQIGQPFLFQAAAADAVQDDAGGEGDQRGQHDGRA